MTRLASTLVAIGFLACASTSYGQTPASTPAPAKGAAAAQRDLNAEAEAMKSSAGSRGTPTTTKKEKRGKLETPEQKQAAMQEMQNRSVSSAKGGPATVDKAATKANPRKAAKDMTPAEQQQLLEQAQKASKP